MTVLATVAGVMITRVNNHYRAAYHSTSYEEAFRAAEAGIELAMAAMGEARRNNTPFPTTLTYHAGSTPPLPTHSGDGNTKLFAKVIIAPTQHITPPGGISPTTPIEKPGWYTIRSTGVAEIPGSNAVTEEASLRTVAGKKNKNSNLRMISFSRDFAEGKLKLPQVFRTVQIVVRPSTSRLFNNAMTSKGAITLTGGAHVNSFDSDNKVKYPGGIFDPENSPEQENADIGSDSLGNLSDLGGNVVKGDAMSNGGTMQRTEGVTGTKTNNFDPTFQGVTAPDWVISTTAMTTSQIVPSGFGTTALAPKRYKTTTAGMDLGSHEVLRIQNDNPANPITNVKPTAYVDIWIDGPMKTNSHAKLNIDPNVVVRIYVSGQVDVGAQTISNGTGIAANLQIYGIDPPIIPGTNPVQYEDRLFDISGQGSFTGVVYAPNFRFDFTGGGHFFGAVVAKTVRMTGHSGFHYDEALGRIFNGNVTSYIVQNYMEDVRYPTPTPPPAI